MVKDIIEFKVDKSEARKLGNLQPIQYRLIGKNGGKKEIDFVDTKITSMKEEEEERIYLCLYMYVVCILVDNVKRKFSRIIFIV